MDSFDDVTVVVRECGERTVAACAAGLESLGARSVFRIRAAPFSAALREGLELGWKEGRPWTWCVDADVIPSAAGFLQLMAAARDMGRSRFELQGLVFDKFFGVHRPCGNHLYRTSMLRKALDRIPREGDSLRPESDMLHAMSRAGHRWVQSRIVVGAHDFEQFYLDAYRKCFLHAHKHAQHASYLQDLWEDLGPGDDDFRVASEAFRAGLRYRDRVLVSKNFLADEAAEALRGLGLREKGALEGDLDPGWLQRSVQECLRPSLVRRARRLERDTYPLGAGFLRSEAHRWLGDRALRLPSSLALRLGRRSASR